MAAEPMRDHQHPMRDSLAARLDQIRGYDVPEDERDDWSPADDVLDISTHRVHDIVLAIGGPTQFFRVWSSGGDVDRVEYHDSWAWPTDVVQLTDDEAAAVVDAFGPWIGAE